MATARPVSPVVLGADAVGAPLASPPVVDHAQSAIVTGRELRLVASPARDEGVRFERVPIDTSESVASHLEPHVPLISGVRLGSSRPVGHSRCSCWQSLRLLGSARRHDHDHLTGSALGTGCPACGRGVPDRPGV